MTAAREITPSPSSGWRKLAVLILAMRLVGSAALAQHAVAWFYVGNVARYHFLTWFLTMLVVVVFMHEIGAGWLQRHYPALSSRFAMHPLSQWLASGLMRLQKSAA